MITVDYISTNGDCIFACQNAAGTSFNSSVTQYFGLSGSLVSGKSTETSAQVTVNTAFQFSQLTCNVTSNGITNASTINLRANSGNAGPTVSLQLPLPDILQCLYRRIYNSNSLMNRLLLILQQRITHRIEQAKNQIYPTHNKAFIDSV